MTNQTASENYSALLGRLQKIERENRNMKRFGALVLVATATLIFMGQTGKNRALDADSLVIRDASGRVRIELGIGDDTSPTLRMYGGSDNKNASLALRSNQNGSTLSFMTWPSGVPFLSLSSEGEDGPSLLLQDRTGGAAIQPASVSTWDNDKFGSYVGRTGTVDTKTGANTKTSAASLTLFGKDGKVIWQAP
jgi:hypothetical protein